MCNGCGTCGYHPSRPARPAAASHFEKFARNDDDDGAKLLTFAHELKAIPSMTMKVAIQSLCNNRGEDCQRHNLLVAMIGGVWQNKSVDPSLVETVTNFLKNQPEFSSALLASTSSLEIFSHFGIGTVQP